MQSSVYAPILKRKHSTVHYFTNGTVYILGGIELGAMTNNHSLIALRLDKKDFSLYSYAPSAAESPKFDYPTMVGHTSHVVNDAIISVLGLPLLQDQAASPLPLVSLPPSSPPFLNITELPNPRYLHTSVVLNETLHVIGGKDTATHKQVDDVMWSYSFASQSWTHQQRAAANRHRSMSGHVTIVYNQWLISCFGENTNSQLISQCTWIDTVSFNVTQQQIPPQIEVWPNARKYASIISLSSSNTHVLFGGQNNTDILDDMWFLDINAPFSMKWTKINTLTNYRRSAHAGALMDENVILYYGGQDSPSSLAADPIYFNITNKEWIHAKNQKSNPQTNLGVDLDSNSNGQNEGKGISGGTIAGILTGVACILGLGIAYFVWRRRNQRRRQDLNQSRAARFSQSPPSQQHYPEKAVSTSSAIRYSSSIMDDDNEKAGSHNKLPGAGLKEGGTNFISLPELALYNSSNRISTISLGTEFNFSAEEYRRQSHHSTASSAAAAASTSSSSGLQHTIPKLEFNHDSIIAKNETSDSNKYELQPQQLQMESLTEGKPVSYKRRGSTGFNRLTLNLFGNSNSTLADPQQPQGPKKNRTSSLFQLRSSRLLQPNTPTTPNMTDNRYPHLQSRVSLSAKSVSSVQWVGFNDTMDGWRDSTGSSLHLAVTNAQRSSMYHSDSSAQSTPKSPMFPQYLKDSAIQHQMFGQESSTGSSPEMPSTATTDRKNQIV
ncbi:hypothetical protein MAM1_0048d03248 [Mucor ambiguus]|uniref:Galactose oxidase n=1 Tax=Mucor ambiguus TaxID=91626 RepID=A0A0C9MP63_9FUNG|nr:hypothetical protein MAM1_0048d03248 [Mucor ambiguus]